MHGDFTTDPNRGQVTTNHQTIMQWVEDHDGHPAAVDTTDHSVGYLRIKFPDVDDHDEFSTMDWREWLDEFEAEELAFVYRDDVESDTAHRVYKLVDRTTAAEHA